MIIEKDEFAQMLCPMSIGRDQAHNCYGPKCFAFEEVGSIPDRSLELERVYDRSPAAHWYYVPTKGDEKAYWARYKMIEQATCGMIPKEEVTMVT